MKCVFCPLTKSLHALLFPCRVNKSWKSMWLRFVKGGRKEGWGRSRKLSLTKKKKKENKEEMEKKMKKENREWHHHRKLPLVVMNSCCNNKGISLIPFLFPFLLIFFISIWPYLVVSGEISMSLMQVEAIVVVQDGSCSCCGCESGMNIVYIAEQWSQRKCNFIYWIYIKSPFCCCNIQV